MNTTRKLAVDPAEAEKKIAAIAKVLGVESTTDYAAIRDAFEQLFAPMADAAKLAIRTMSAREVALCKQKNLSPARYVAGRDAIRRNRIRGG